MEICEHCHAKPATIHIAQTDEAQPEDHHYCEDCAEELGLELPNPQDEALEEEEFPLLTCPTCQRTSTQFEENHTVGCVQCYSTFAQSIAQRKNRFKGFHLYQGKKYNVAKSQAFFTELEQLKQELTEAVKLQKFELATVLRDRIRLLESKGEQ